MKNIQTRQVFNATAPVLLIVLLIIVIRAIARR